MTPSRTRRPPSVVLAGRANVGKSTLFNRVTGRRRAIVTPVPGTTRDVLREPVDWQGAHFELVDTGGLFGASEDPLQDAVAEMGLGALADADVVVMLVDAREGLVPADWEVATHVRETGVPIVLAVNKVDGPRAAEGVDEFHALGFLPLIRLAAEHGLGVGDLLDEVTACLPRPYAASPPTEAHADELAVAIVGRPNVGKSSLVNLLAREHRVLVSEQAGTTRDAVDTLIRWRGHRVRLVDTAGIRRPGRVAQSGQVESVSVTVARRAMRRADVAVVVFDASQGVTHRDAAIAGEAEAAGCGIILAANKWDLVKGREGFAQRFDQEVRDGLKFADYAPLVHLSALTGHRVSKLLEMAARVERARSAHIPTGDLNRFVERVTRRHPLPSTSRGDVRIHYATQVGVRPPRFLLFTNRPAALHFSYTRFLTNRLREEFDFVGAPIQLKVRARRAAAVRARPRRGG